ncbi:MAG: hypothetical protein JWQ90_3562 [Hydrocarboniphaga sp.]|nr:hypothetical protein [Hydrocarboniphaga sp.]
MKGEGQDFHSLVGDFAGADDLLWAAQTGELQAVGKVVLSRSGRIGPLVELEMARRAYSSIYSDVVVAPPFAKLIRAAMTAAAISGTHRDARIGVFPLGVLGRDGDTTDQWTLWASRADQAAIYAGFPPKVAAEIVGALGELQDNIFRHSSAYESGLVAFAASRNTFEVVASDAGIGVRASLHQCPEYANVEDAGAALKVAVMDGESRFGRNSGCGFGMGQMFRALANHDGELRFRSGDHALQIYGHSPSLQGRLELLHKASLPGLTISVLCRAPGSTESTL